MNSTTADRFSWNAGGLAGAAIGAGAWMPAAALGLWMAGNRNGGSFHSCLPYSYPVLAAWVWWLNHRRQRQQMNR